jgi:hypothetical protein
VATGAALAASALLADSRFLTLFPAGLDYFSTFQIGLYTQPLGFVLLVLWYVSYAESYRSRRRFAIASLLLALTVLANFFNAVTAAIFIAATLASDLVSYRKAAGQSKREARAVFIAHFISPFVALGLTAFWVVPMVGQYEFFVTRPHILEIGKLISPALLGWYALALVGAVSWLRRPSRLMWPYLATCLILAVGVVFAATIAPRWFPLQSSRFLTTLNFLLAVPIAQALAAAFRTFARVLGEMPSRRHVLTFGQARYTTITALAILIILTVTSPGPRWAYAFYPEGGQEDLDAILAFGREHRDGRYLVEVINPSSTDVSFDARAVNSMLGAQGNESLSSVFHEASPNALFTLPLINAFSQYPDSFGISSLLADDLDFSTQPMATHLERARLLGVRYLVIRSPEMKMRVAAEPTIAARHDFGWWSVYELGGERVPRTRILRYKPALVVSDFTLKERRSNERSFIRWAEEQFAEGWFEVLLARSTETRLDKIENLNQFGALVVDRYECDDEDTAFERLRQFAQSRALVLVSSDATLFRKIRAARSQFPKAEIIERIGSEPGLTLEAVKPTNHYQGSPIRQEWMAIRRALDRDKIAVETPATGVTAQLEKNSIQLSFDTLLEESVPVIIDATYHPGWRRADGDTIYTATPFNILTFARATTQIRYGRSLIDFFGLWLSIVTLALMLLFALQRVPSRIQM